MPLRPTVPEGIAFGFASHYPVGRKGCGKDRQKTPARVAWRCDGRPNRDDGHALPESSRHPHSGGSGDADGGERLRRLRGCAAPLSDGPLCFRPWVESAVWWMRFVERRRPVSGSEQTHSPTRLLVSLARIRSTSWQAWPCHARPGRYLALHSERGDATRYAGLRAASGDMRRQWGGIATAGHLLRWGQILGSPTHLGACELSSDNRPPLEPGSASRRLVRPLSPSGSDHLSGTGCVAEPWTPDSGVSVLGLGPHPLAGAIGYSIGAGPGIERGTATPLVSSPARRMHLTPPQEMANEAADGGKRSWGNRRYSRGWLT